MSQPLRAYGIARLSNKKQTNCEDFSAYPRINCLFLFLFIYMYDESRPILQLTIRLHRPIPNSILIAYEKLHTRIF